jgi:hypothetical protein
MYDILLAALRNLNDLLTAGIAITAFSLLLYALSFNLRDRVARSFGPLLRFHHDLCRDHLRKRHNGQLQQLRRTV